MRPSLTSILKTLIVNTIPVQDRLAIRNRLTGAGLTRYNILDRQRNGEPGGSGLRGGPNRPRPANLIRIMPAEGLHRTQHSESPLPGGAFF